MAIALHQDALSQMESDIRQRPNGPRVLRLLREMTYPDGRLVNGIEKVGEYPLVAAVLVAMVLLLGLVVASIPPAQSAVNGTPVSIGIDPAAYMQPTSSQKVDHHWWLRDAHQSVARQGKETTLPATF